MSPNASVALVTGSASGLGRAVAKELLAAGSHVVIAVLPTSPRGSDVAELSSPGKVVYAPCDVTGPGPYRSPWTPPPSSDRYVSP
ncbi:SDR family NAD(P)-dependent oxidoreductase [Streptomyces melanosporofaciens]|uniref:SDR family NAD(P)-dependent oxidoreductase n=1 Tax=Streptomyces melanosporofaciens TaxID=67327 RepID=UPI00142FE8EB